MSYLEQMLSVGEVATFLNCSIYTIRRRLKTGELEGFHDGGAWKIPSSSYREYVNSRMQKSRLSSITPISSRSEDRSNRNEEEE